MSSHQLLRRLLHRCPDILRKSWIPVTEGETDKPGKFKTMFGGNQPFRPTNFKWPICEECHAHKSFLCQVNLSDLPPALQQHTGLSSGLFQLFYCLECMPLNCFTDIYVVKETDFVPSLTSLAAEVAVREKSFCKESLPKTLQNFVEDSTETPDIEFDGETFQEKVVFSWRESEEPEVPQPQEIQSFNEGELERRSELSQEELGRLYEALEESDCSPRGGVKLGGYVRWCQGVESPTCPTCQTLMTVTFLQLEDDPLYPFSWGDAGTAHVTLCPVCAHPGLSWACC